MLPEINTTATSPTLRRLERTIGGPPAGRLSDLSGAAVADAKMAHLYLDCQVRGWLDVQIDILGSPHRLGLFGKLSGSSAKIPDNEAFGSAGWKPGRDGAPIKNPGGCTTESSWLAS